MFNIKAAKQKSKIDASKQLGQAESKKPAESEFELITSEKVLTQGATAIRDLIAPASLRVESNFLELNGQFARTFFVYNYPRYLSVGWFSPFINFNVTMDIAMYIYPVESPLILKQLKKKVGNLQAQISQDQEKGMPRDPVLETALQDIEGLRDAITQGTEHFFQFGLYITIYSNDKKDLDQTGERIESMFGSKLVGTHQALWQMEQGFNSTLPLANDELGISSNMNTSPVSSALPFISSDLTSDNGILYGVNRHNNSLILFDRFSLPNANSVVFATSGAGKSYAVKLEVLRSMMMGSDVIIIDPEREYLHLAEAVGGTYIDISLSSDSKINPFDLPAKVGDQTSTGDTIRSAVITLKGLVRLMLGTLTNEEDSIVDRALLESYAKKDITIDSDLSAVQSPLMFDFQDILEGMEGGASLAERLKKYTEGTFAGLLNNPTNVDINNQLVVFSVRDLEDELRPMAIYTVVNYIWNVVRASLKKRILVVDEAWWLMQHEDSAKFIFALAKRGRKYYLGITTITQDVNDFLGSPYGQAIVTNSSLQLLLRQSPASIDIVTKTFLLTEGEKYLLLESAVGEGIFFAGNKHAAIKIVASYAEDQLITSDPRQLLEIEQAKKEFAAQHEGGEEVGEAAAANPESAVTEKIAANQ